MELQALGYSEPLSEALNEVYCFSSFNVWCVFLTRAGLFGNSMHSFKSLATLVTCSIIE
jgi:hypothetical protein